MHEFSTFFMSDRHIFSKVRFMSKRLCNNSQKHIIYYNTMQSLNLPKVFNGTKKLQIRIHMFIRHISIPHYLLQLYPHHIFDKKFNFCKNFWTFPPYSYSRIKWSKLIILTNFNRISISTPIFLAYKYIKSIQQ